MIIRCPHCEHTRSISEGKIPPQAEYATCPKCRHRFLFRSLPRDVEAAAPPAEAAASAAAKQARKQSGEDRHHPQTKTAGPKVLRPQEAFRESEEQRDIWDAMDALHERWEAQLDQHVAEVEQPRPAKSEAAAETFFPPDSHPRAPEAGGTAPAAPAAPDAPGAANAPGTSGAPGAPEARPRQFPAPEPAPEPGPEPAPEPGPELALTPPKAAEGTMPQPRQQTQQQMPQQTQQEAAAQAPLQSPDQSPAQPPAQAPGQSSGQSDVRSPSQQSSPGNGKEPQGQAESGSGKSAAPGAAPDNKSADRGPTGADNSAGTAAENSLERAAENSAGQGLAVPGTVHAVRPDAGPDNAAAAGLDALSDTGSNAGPDNAPHSAPVAAPPPEQAARPRFPVYGEDGPDPEERVEKDMAMLRAASASGPMRDLGRLREFPDPAQASESEAAADGELLHLPGQQAAPEPERTEQTRTPAWEHPRGSRLAAFNATVRGVMLGGPDYFAGMSGAGSLVPGYLFFLIMGYICIICSLAWRGLAELLLPGLLPPFPRGLVLPALLLLAPAALGLMQLFVTGWIRLLLRLLVPDQADFGLVYKVVSYSVAPFALSIVPFAGPLLGAAWFMASLSSGCRGALRLSLPLSILLPLPPALLLLTALAWYFL